MPEPNLDAHSFSPGQIVEARSRLWRVDSIEEDILEASPIDGLVLEHQKFYLPMEDVKRGKLSPPSDSIVGNFAEQKLLLRALKLDLLNSTAPMICLQRSRVIPEEYQLVPLVMSMDMPRVRMLIADDVGLGKTIEAGLIIKELIGRDRAKRILIVCPAHLREHWQKTLDYFFHLDTRVISTRHIRAMERELPPGANPWEHYDVLIASIDYVKKDPTRHHVFEQEWDIALIDEAHNCAKPHQTQERQKVEMFRWEFAKDISKRCRHLLLLTATPHNGYSDSYASLLRLLDMGAVSGPQHDPRINREKARPYVCQRRRKDVVEWIESAGGRESPFPERDQKEVSIPLSTPHKLAIERIEAFTDHIANVAKEEGRKYRRLMATWTIMHFHKRALSSPKALLVSLKNRIEKVESRIRDMETEETAGLTLSEARAVALDEDPGEKLSDEEAIERLEKETFGRENDLRLELDLLKDALTFAKKVTPSRDEKLQRTKSLVYERLRIKPKLIIFTKYWDTLDYLEGQLKSDNRFKDVEVITLYGDMNEGQRKDAFFEFEDAKRAVLIATDCISEGIDLQYMASQIIHYELPWNPNRLEQRNGRIDRYGQPERSVYIRTLVMEDALDAAILKVLVKKAEQIRDDYGFSPPFFGDDVTVLDLIREAGLDVSLSTQTRLLEFEGGRPRESPEINPFSSEAIERMKGESFYGQTKIELGDVQKRLEETRKIVGSQEEIEKFVISGLRRYGTEVRERAGLYDFRFELSAFYGQGFDEDMRDVTFDPHRAAKNRRLTLIDISNPIVRHLIENIRVTAFEDGERYGRTAYITSQEAEEVTAVYHLLVRYSVQTDPVSLLEEIVPVGITVYGNKVLDEKNVQHLLDSSPVGMEHSRSDVLMGLDKALNKDVSGVFEAEVEKRRSQMCIERRRLRETFEDEESPEWIKGIDRVSVASIDLLTVTIYYPPVGGRPREG